MNYKPVDVVGFSKSKARRALLSLFFTNPEQEYFPRQLERLSGIFVGNLQKELIRLEQGGLLNSRRLGKMKLYKLNIQHPLYPELKSLVAKTVGLEEMIRGELAKIEGIHTAGIYGSFARHQERADSDIDLLVVGQVNEKVLLRAVKFLEKRLQREINYTLYLDDDWVQKRASKDSFVIELLKNPIISLIGDLNAIRQSAKRTH